MKRNWILLSLLALPGYCLAEPAPAPEDLDAIREVRVREVELDPAYLPPGLLGVDLGQIIQIGEGLMTLGQKAWEIIQNGKGVSNIQLGPPISVLPNLSSDPAEAFASMEGWSDPRARAYRVEFLNWRNAVAVSFDYLVHFQHSGSYNGHGRYLHGVTVSPGTNIMVGWGWGLDASVQHLTTANSGTRLDPVAGVRVAVSYTVQRRALGREYKGSHVIFVKGDGQIVKIEEEQEKPGED